MINSSQIHFGTAFSSPAFSVAPFCPTTHTCQVSSTTAQRSQSLKGVFIETQLNSTQLNWTQLDSVNNSWLSLYLGRDVINKNTTDLAVRCCSTRSVEFSWVELCRYKHPLRFWKCWHCTDGRTHGRTFDRFYKSSRERRLTRGQSNLTKSASRGAHSPVRGHPRGSKVVPLNSWGRVSY